MTDKEKIRAEIEEVKLIIQANRAQGAFAEGYLLGQESVVEHLEKFIDSMPEEPVSEDLDKFATQSANKLYPPEFEMADDNWKQRAGYVKGCKDGAKWQRERDAKYKADNNICCMNFDDIEAARIGAYEQGKSDMKQQIMKDAISAKVTEIYYPTDSCLEIEATLPEDRFEDGDKVLIIKED